MRLKQQEYRHVDYVSFESNEIVGNMIGAWISSGTQRIGCEDHSPQPPQPAARSPHPQLFLVGRWGLCGPLPVVSAGPITLAAT